MELGFGVIQADGLIDQGGEIFRREVLPPTLPDKLAGLCGNKHSDATTLFKDALAGQQCQALAGGSRIDAVEGSQFIRGGRLRPLC